MVDTPPFHAVCMQMGVFSLVDVKNKYTVHVVSFPFCLHGKTVNRRRGSPAHSSPLHQKS
jgi:hypothetical protein